LTYKTSSGLTAQISSKRRVLFFNDQLASITSRLSRSLNMG
jgi:hypothetical protein